MPDYVDSGQVRITITPSGAELATGSGTDAAVVRVSLVPSGYEGDFAISDPSAVIVAEDVSSGGGSGDPADEEPSTVFRANFIGEGRMRRNKTALAVSNRWSGLESNRFTGKLG